MMSLIAYISFVSLLFNNFCLFQEYYDMLYIPWHALNVSSFISSIVLNCIFMHLHLISQTVFLYYLIPNCFLHFKLHHFSFLVSLARSQVICLFPFSVNKLDLDLAALKLFRSIHLYFLCFQSVLCAIYFHIYTTFILV